MGARRPAARRLRHGRRGDLDAARRSSPAPERLAAGARRRARCLPRRGGTAPSPRSTSGCRAGATTRHRSSACSPTTCAWTRRGRPRRGVPRGAAEAEAAVQDLAGRAGGLRGRVVPGRSHDAGARGPAGDAQVLPGHSARRRAPSSGRRRRPGRRRAARPRRGRVLPDLDEAGRDVDRRELVRERRAEHERERARRHVPRIVLSDGTEPEAARRPVADGALAGTRPRRAPSPGQCG